MNLDTIGEKIDDIEVSISHRIIELFSAGLYSSPNKAFEELVCNSYDAFASKVAVYVPSDSTVEGAYIWVCDNGEGLNPKELKNLWRIGESTKRQGNVRDKKRLQIGQFGIGKLATYILARKLTYISKKDGRYILATMDYDLIKEDYEKLLIDEREVKEDEAQILLQQYVDEKIIQFNLFLFYFSRTLHCGRHIAHIAHCLCNFILRALRFSLTIDYRSIPDSSQELISPFSRVSS